MLIGQKVARGWDQLAWAGGAKPEPEEDEEEEMGALDEEEELAGGRGGGGGDVVISEDAEVTGVTQSLPQVQG